PRIRDARRPPGRLLARRPQARHREHERLSRVSNRAASRSANQLAPGLARPLRARAVPPAEGDHAGVPASRGSGHEGLSSASARVHENAAVRRLVEHPAPHRLSRPGTENMTTATQVPFVDLQAQYEQIRTDVDRAMRQVIDRGDFIHGSAVAPRHNLVVIEDAAQAHGARVNGRRAGAFGHAAAFSFYPSKNLGAYGDAGIVVTDDGRAAEKLRLLGNYGQRVKYEHAVEGRNSRLDTMQAAVLAVKLPHLDRWNAARRA